MPKFFLKQRPRKGRRRALKSVSAQRCPLVRPIRAEKRISGQRISIQFFRNTRGANGEFPGGVSPNGQFRSTPRT